MKNLKKTLLITIFLPSISVVCFEQRPIPPGTPPGGHNDATTSGTQHKPCDAAETTDSYCYINGKLLTDPFTALDSTAAIAYLDKLGIDRSQQGFGLEQDRPFEGKPANFKAWQYEKTVSPPNTTNKGEEQLRPNPKRECLGTAQSLSLRVSPQSSKADGEKKTD